MSLTSLRQVRTVDTQQVAPFTGGSVATGVGQ